MVFLLNFTLKDPFPPSILMATLLIVVIYLVVSAVKWQVHLLVIHQIKYLINNLIILVVLKGFSFGNLPYLKSAECLRKVKSGIKSESQFSNCYMVDIAATQQYFRYLLPDSLMPGYIEYFVQDPFIIHMYYHK